MSERYLWLPCCLKVHHFLYGRRLLTGGTSHPSRQDSGDVPSSRPKIEEPLRDAAEWGSNVCLRHTTAIWVASGSSGEVTTPDSLHWKNFENLPYSATRSPYEADHWHLSSFTGWRLLVRQDVHMGTCRFQIMCSTRCSDLGQALRGHWPSRPFFPWATGFGITLNGPNHGASASVEERLLIRLRWLLYKFKTSREKEGKYLSYQENQWPWQRSGR